MSAIVNSVAYAEGCRVTDVALDAVSDVLQDPSRFVWIGLHEPDEALLQKIQQTFGLHDLAIEDAHRAHQRPKLEEYGDSLFVVLRTAQVRDGTIEFGETHVFVGPRYVVTVRHGPSLSYAEVRARCESAPRLLRRGPGFVLYAIMDFVVDHYFLIVDALEDQLERLEDDMFRGTFSRATTERIYDMKRDLVALKRAVSPLVEVCNRLVRFDVALIPARVFPGRLRPRDPHQRDDRQSPRAPHDRSRGQPLPHCGPPERGHEEARRVGGDPRRPDLDRGHLRDELRVHAGAPLALRLPGGGGRHGRGVRRALRLVPARGVAVSSVARLVLRAIHRTVGRFLPHRPFSLGATHRCRARTVS